MADVQRRMSEGPFVEAFPGEVALVAEHALADDAVVAVDREARITFWNAGSEQLFGWPAAEALGQDLAMLLPEDRQDEATRILRALDGATEAVAVETVRLHRSGARIPVSCRLSPLAGPDGEVFGACAVVRDNGPEVAMRRELERARRQAEARFVQSVVAMATLDTSGTVIAVNPALCALSGFAEQDLLGRPTHSFLAAGDVPVVSRALDALGSGGRAQVHSHLLLRRADGDLVDTRVTIYSVHDDDDAGITRLEVMVEDISAEVAARRELELREAKWQSLARNAADVALLANADATLQFVSASAHPRFGYVPAEVVGATGFDFLHPDDEPGVRLLWDEALAEPDGFRDFEGRLRHADGSWRWIEGSITNRLEDPAVAAAVINITDITGRKTAEAVLNELAGLDTLTGLASRPTLMAALEAAFASDRAGATSVLVLDLAGFKLVNDAHGQQTGDAVLAEVGARLLSATDGDDLIARLGGDRFAVVLRTSDPEAIRAAVDRVRQALAATVVVEGAEVHVAACIGVAFGPAPEAGVLLAAAEQALREAKDRGVGSVEVVSAHSPSLAIARARLVEDLRRGVGSDELVVHFQPVVSLSDGVVVAAEALVRWQHPERGLLAPGEFIEAAEESGLILDLGEQVLRAACRAAAAWRDRGRGGAPFHVAVNLSAKQLVAPGVVDVVRRCLAESGASGQSLMLEVTESAVMADVEAAGRTLAQLRGLGLSLAVDDFGTGYSSLTYLKRFPVTALKIDRSFVSGLGQSSDDAAIVASTIGLSRSMGLDCIAEGVETEDQRQALQELGCQFAQGYLWSPAVDADAFDAWFAARATGGVRPSLSTRPAAPADDLDCAVVSARIAELQAQGASLHSIAAALNADGLVAPRGKRWHVQSVARFLTTRRLT